MADSVPVVLTAKMQAAVTALEMAGLENMARVLAKAPPDIHMAFAAMQDMASVADDTPRMRARVAVLEAWQEYWDN